MLICWSYFGLAKEVYGGLRKGQLHVPEKQKVMYMYIEE